VNGQNVNIIGVGTDSTYNWFGQLFAHELAEMMSDPVSNGVVVSGGANLPRTSQFLSNPSAPPSDPSNWGQIADFEPEDAAGAIQYYTYHLGGRSGPAVQAVWSYTNKAFVVTDGTSQLFQLTPDWSGVGTSTPTFANTYDLTINGDQLANTVNDSITLSGDSAGDVSVNLNRETAYFEHSTSTYEGTTLRAITVKGLTGSNTLTLDFSGGNWLANLSGGITFDGGSGGSLWLQGTPTAGPFGNETDTPTGPTAGTIRFDSNPLITYKNVGLIVDTTALSGTATYKGTSSAEAINLHDVGTINGTQVSEFDSYSSNTFAPVLFANKPTVKIAGVDGSDTITLNNATPAAGLKTVIVTTGPTAAVLNILATNPDFTTNYVSGANATVNVGNAGNIQGIAGPLNLESPNAFIKIVLNDSADPTSRTVTLDRMSTANPADSEKDSDVWGTVSNLAPGLIAYEYLDASSLTINGGSGGNQFTVNSTMMGMPGTTTINGGAGNDTFTITGAGLGASSVNIFNGQGGDNVFKLLSGAPAGVQLTINGGSGPNWLDYSAYAAAVTVNLATGTATGTTSIANIQDVIGSSNYSDTLTGNAQGNILIGGNASDTITGGSGRSILIGGAGADTIRDGSGEDILIAGWVNFGANQQAALEAILTEWQRTDESHTQRMSNIRAGVGPNNAYALVWGSTVLDDGLGGENLYGGAAASALDWFWVDFAASTPDALWNYNGKEHIN
jgi:hypothetical protein